jgi:hypothetical protein
LQSRQKQKLDEQKKREARKQLRKKQKQKRETRVQKKLPVGPKPIAELKQDVFVDRLQPGKSRHATRW